MISEMQLTLSWDLFRVMEYMAGGDVFDQVVKNTHYTEKDARDLISILLKAVSTLHKLGIAHRGTSSCLSVVVREKESFSLLNLSLRTFNCRHQTAKPPVEARRRSRDQDCRFRFRPPCPYSLQFDEPDGNTVRSSLPLNANMLV